jgi:hypothetical protein
MFCHIRSHSLRFDQFFAFDQARLHFVRFYCFRSHSIPFRRARSHLTAFHCVSSHPITFNDIRSHSITFNDIQWHLIMKFTFSIDIKDFSEFARVCAAARDFGEGNLARYCALGNNNAPSGRHSRSRRWRVGFGLPLILRIQEECQAVSCECDKNGSV